MRRERGIERHAEQAALARRVDRDGQERRRQERSALDDPQLARLLADEDPAVGGDGKGRRARQGAPDLRLRKAVREGHRRKRRGREQQASKGRPAQPVWSPDGFTREVGRCVDFMMCDERPIGRTRRTGLPIRRSDALIRR